ncbi:MAG TPA: PIG-L family deacetylase [Pyrinomonadaceae bacterium]|nr:PIG-L family deacetylase [Pyrinomonadaceae bacterium]
MNTKIIRTALALLFVSLLITAPRAQQPAPATTKQSPEDRVALYQALLDLTNPWTVMCIAAHPDDEDGTSLIVMRRKYGAHTVSLFSTFGEGGQNAIGPELYEELGAIRARETMAAAEVQGSEAYFLGLKDFGYSKSADETFKIWGHEEALRRMVLQIRKLRPDVIITNHSVTNNDHGHHQATARLTLEAFEAAADPKRFPEQLKDGVTVWQVQRLFVRAPRSTAQSTGQKPDRAGGRNDLVTIDPNERDPIRETIYAEEALRGLQKHATQGPWPKTFAEFAARFRAFTGQSAAPGQLPPIRYALVLEAKGAEALTKDSHNFIDGLRLNEAIAKQLQPPTIDGKPLTEFVDQRGRVLNALIAASQQVFGKEISGGIKDVLAELRRARMLVRLNKSLAIASGVSAHLTTANDVLVPGETASFELTVANNGEDPIRVNLIASSGGGDDKGNILLSARHHLNSAVPPGETIRIPTPYKMPENATLTVPHAAHLYDKGFAGTPVVAPIFVELRGVKFPIIVQRLSDVAPGVEIMSAEPSLVVLTPQTNERPPSFRVKLKSHLNEPFEGLVGAFANYASRRGFELVSSTLSLVPAESREVSLSSKMKIREFSSIDLTVETYKGKSRSTLSKSTVPIITADAHVAPNLRVGYIRGFDFSLPNALAALGVESKELSVDEVKTADLQKYSSIIVDNRVYESTPGLIEANQKLLDYAKNGGTLIVFYHKSFEWNPDERRKRPQLSPYKLILGDERITDENAPITFLEPQHPLLNFPNKLGQEDFANWIQERGLYYPKEWDPQFHALLQSNDPGEAPLKGGLLAADYGRGRYIYTSMVWYRELRAGVPGAYRMLANIISYGARK